MKKLLGILVLGLLYCNILFASDEKPGRFFEDQPDVNDDYQIHFIYTLAADSKDREWDINGKIEKITDKMNKLHEKLSKKVKGSTGGKKYKYELNDWFLLLYEILLGQKEGPRMGTFIAIYGCNETIDLIHTAIEGKLIKN